jgi:glycosyltransferase involved in cell wall biosynthesis
MSAESRYAAVSAVAGRDTSTAGDVARAGAAPTRQPAVVMLVSKDDPSAGGAQRQALLLAERLAAAGDEVTVVTARPPGSASTSATAGRPRAGIESVRLRVPFHRALSYLAVLLVWVALHRRRADILHAHSVPLGVLACVLGWLTRASVIIKIPSWKSFGYLRGTGLRRRFYRWVVNRAAWRIVAVSRELADGVVTDGLAADKVVIIPNGVDLDGLAAPGDAGALKAEILGDEDATAVLFVGRLVEEKAIDRLLDVWAALPPGRQVLVIVGDGPLRGDLERRAAAQGLAESVRFVGHRHDALRFYAMADVFVLPSATEGLSNSLLEAMAAGLPVVASDVGGNRDVITPGSGILVDWRQVPACVALLSRLLQDDRLRKDMGAAARERARAFAMEAIVRRYRDLYRAAPSA